MPFPGQLPARRNSLDRHGAPFSGQSPSSKHLLLRLAASLCQTPCPLPPSPLLLNPPSLSQQGPLSSAVLIYRRMPQREGALALLSTVLPRMRRNRLLPIWGLRLPRSSLLELVVGRSAGQTSAQAPRNSKVQGNDSYSSMAMPSLSSTDSPH